MKNEWLKRAKEPRFVDLNDYKPCKTGWRVYAELLEKRREEEELWALIAEKSEPDWEAIKRQKLEDLKIQIMSQNPQILGVPQCSFGNEPDDQSWGE